MEEKSKNIIVEESTSSVTNMNIQITNKLVTYNNKIMLKLKEVCDDVHDRVLNYFQDTPVLKHSNNFIMASSLLLIVQDKINSN